MLKDYDSFTESDDTIKTIKRDILSVVKMIALVLMSDEDTMEDFLSTYDNYEKLSHALNRHGIFNEYKKDESGFCRNPIACWMELISVSMVSLHAFPDKSGITCDIIGTKDESGSSTKHVGMCFSMMVTVESFDWKPHNIELFIPSENSSIGMRTLLLIDDEIKLFAEI